MDDLGDESSESSAADTLKAGAARKFQQILDSSTVHIVPRWIGFVVALAIYALRVYLVNGWYIITYSLGIFLLNNFIGFLSPQVDPESEGPLLPTTCDDDFKPFSRRVPEFKFWYRSGVLMFFFSAADASFHSGRAGTRRPRASSPPFA